MAEEKVGFLAKIFGKKYDEEETDQSQIGAGSVSNIQEIPKMDVEPIGEEPEDTRKDIKTLDEFRAEQKEGVSQEELFKEDQKKKREGLFKRIQNFWAIQNKDIYEFDQAGNPILDEDGKIKRKDVGDLGWGLATKRTTAPIKTLFTAGINALSPIASEIAEFQYNKMGIDDETYYLGKRYKQERREEKALKNDTRYNIEQQEELEMESKGDTAIEEEYKLKIEEVAPILDPAIKVFDLFTDKEEQVIILQKQVNIAEAEGDTETVEKIQAQIDVLTTEMKKTQLEYALDINIEGDNIDAIYDSVRAIVGDYTNEQIDQVASKAMNKKLSAVTAAQTELDEIRTRYAIRSDENIINITPTSILGVIESYGAMVYDSDKETIFGSFYSDFGDILKDAKEVGGMEEKIVKQKMSRLNNLVKYTASQILVSGIDAEEGKEILEQMMNTDEIIALKDFILTDETINTFFDEKGNFDNVAFAKYVKNTEQWQKYGGILDSLNAEAKSSAKYTHAEESSVLGSAWNQAAAFGYDKFFKKFEQGYIDYKKAVDEYGADSRQAKGLKGTYLNAMGSVADPFIVETKQQDASYMQNSRNRTRDSVNTLVNMAQNNPAETAALIASIAITAAGFAPGVAGYADKALKINSIQSPMWRTLLKAGTTIGSEVAEGSIIGMSIDAMGGTQSDARYLFLDGAIGALRSLNVLKQGFKIANEKKYVDTLLGEITDGGINLSSDKARKLIQNRMQKDGKDVFLAINGYKLTDFIDESGKVKYADLTQTLELGRIKVAESMDPRSLVYESYIKQAVDSGQIKNNGIDFLYKKAEGRYKDRFTDIVKKYTKSGVVDKAKVVGKYLSDTMTTVEQLGKMKILQGVTGLMNQAGVTKPLDDQYKQIKGILDNARKGADEASLKLIDNAQSALDEVYSEMRMMPLYVANDVGPEVLQNMKGKVAELNKQLSSVVKGTSMSSDITKVYDLPKEILENIDNPQKISELIFANEKKYSAYGINTYDINEYTKANKAVLEKQLGKKGYKRIESILQTMADLNGGRLRIYELPQSIRDVMVGINGFTTFVRGGDETTMIVSTIGGMVDILGDSKKIANVENLLYIKTMCHELGHNIMFSLKPNIRKQLFKYMGNYFDGEVTEKKILSLLPETAKNPERIKYLLSIQGNGKLFSEELAADIMSEAIQGSIFGVKGSTENIGNAIMKQIKGGNPPSVILESDNPFRILGKKLVTAIESMYNSLVTQKNPEDLKGMMYYIAANILEGNKNWVDQGKQASKMMDGNFFTYVYGGKIYDTIEGNMYKTKESVIGAAKEKYKRQKYILSTPTRNEAGSWSVQVEITPEVKPQTVPVNYYAYKQEGDILSTLKEGVDSFDVSKIYSETIVRDMLFDPNVTSESLGAVISLSYNNTMASKNILEGLTENSPQRKKFFEAMQFAQSKHGLAVSNLQKFWKDGVIDLTKKVDGKAFYETLANVSTKVTKQGFVEFAGQDLIKFLNISDKQAYNTISAGYMDFVATQYDTKVISKVEDFFTKIGSKGETFGQRYVDFTNIIEKRIYDIALSTTSDSTAKKMASDISKDVVSRLMVGGQGYLSTINDFMKGGKNLDNIVDEIAYGLVRKNKTYSKGSYFSDIYNDIIRKFEGKGTNIDNADMYSDILTKTNVDLKGKKFQWASYEKSFFNFLSARSSEYISLALKDSGIEKIKMDIDTFAKFIDKVSIDNRTIYSTVLDNEMNKLGILSEMDLGGLSFQTGRKEIIGVYQDDLIKNKDKFIGMIGEKKYNKLMNDLEKMSNDGLSEKEIKFFLDENSKRMSSYGRGMTIDGFFRDTMTQEQIMEKRKQGRENSLIGLTNVKKTKELLDTVEELDSPSVEAAVGAVTSFISDYSKTVDDIKSLGMREVSSMIVKNDLLKPFFNIDGNKAKLKTVELKYGKTSQARLEFDNNLYTAKGNWLTKSIGALVNPATVADSDKFIGKVLMESLDDMNRNFFVGDKDIYNFLKRVNKEGKFISKKTFMEYLTQELNQHIANGDLTYKKFSTDVANVYARKYAKVGSLTYLGSSMEGYRELVDAYVEMLSKRHKKFGQYKIVAEGFGGKSQVKSNELLNILDEIGETNGGKLFASSRSKSVEADKMLGLGGNWLSVSTEDLAKIKEKAAIYHPKMFNNFLYKSFASTDSTFNWIDRMMKRGRKIEGAAATAQYTMFYSIFGAGIPAMTQQQFSNMIHLFGKTVAEMGIESIDDVGSLLKVVDDIIPSELTKIDFMSDRPELLKVVEGQKKSGKLGKTIDTLLQGQSSLTWSDKSVERAVKKYSLASALLEKGYTTDAANEFISDMIKYTEEYTQKGYGEWVSIDRLMRYGNEDALKTLGYKLTTAVNEGKMTLEASENILSDITQYGKKLEPLRDVTQNARIKTMTFYQMSKTPELVQNFIGGRAGSANMRFLNRASRKAGDYGFKVADAFINKDMGALGKIIRQVAAEGLYASKVYMYMDNASDGGADYDKFMGSMFLPYVVMNMVMLNVPENIVNLTTSDVYRKNLSGWEKVSNLVSNMFYDFGTKFKGRIGTAPMYWASQTVKLLNGLNKLDEDVDTSDVYSTKVAGVPVLGFIAEIFSDILQQRIGRFNTDMTSGIYRNYLSNSNKNYLINFLTNAKVTNDVVGADRIKEGFYDIIKAEEDGIALGLKIIGYSSNDRLALRAYDQYYKATGLEQYNGGPYVLELLDQLDRQVDGASIEKTLLARGEDYSVINEMTIAATQDSWSDEAISLEDAKKLSDEKYKPFELIVGHALMNSNEGNKMLFEAGKGVTKEEKQAYIDDINKAVKEVEEKILEMEKTNPGLIKSAAYDPAKIEGIISGGLNRFGEQQRIGIIMRAMSNANRTLIKETHKAVNGKDWYTKNSKQPEFQRQVEEEAYVFDRELAGNMYNTVLQGNQTLAQTLQFLHTNTDKDRPLKNKLTEYSALGTYIGLDMIEKNIASQGLSSMGVNNPLAERNSLIWNRYNGLEPEKKEDALKQIFSFKLSEADYIDKYSDPVLAENQKMGLAVSDIDHLVELGKDEELLNRLAPDIKNYLDHVTVSKPLTDEKIMELVEGEIFKEPGTGKKKKGSINFNKLADKLNKFSGFKNNFYEQILKQQPLDRIQYKAKGNKIIPIKLGELEAKKVLTKYDFIKPKAPISEKTPDIVVQTVKTSKSSGKYTAKSIKGGNVYKVKTTKGKK